MSDNQTTTVEDAPQDDADMPNLTELSIDELSALEETLVEQFEAQSKIATPETMDDVRTIVAAVESVRAEATRRVELAALNASISSTTVKTLTADATGDEPEAAVDEATEFSETEAAPAEPVEEAEELSAKKKVDAKDDAQEDAADGGSDEDEESMGADEAVELAEDETKNEPTTEAETSETMTEDKEFAVSDEAGEAGQISPDGLESTTTNTVPAEPRKLAITASADVPGYAAGQELAGVNEIAEALMAKRSSTRGTDRGNDGYQYLVASIQTREYDEAHTLGNDAIVNLNTVEEALKPEALTAAGGIKAPLTPYYELVTFGDSVRPVRDALPGFQADRGGMRFVPSPVISDTAAGANVYAESVDASATPYGSGKGLVTITVGNEKTVKVDVVPRIIKVGNLMARTFPEMVAAWTKLLLAQHARTADSNLLNYLAGSDSTSISGGVTYGAVTTLLGHIDQINAGYRSRHRIASSVKFRAILPFWVKDILRADIARHQFGADYAVSDAQIEEWFSVRNINVTWHYDQSSSTTSIFASQSAGPYLKFPTSVEWFFFPEGTWLFLDGGTLDLGLVRDSTLNSTNDYTIFAETFEAAAKVGQQSLRVVSTLNADGSTSGPNSIVY